MGLSEKTWGGCTEREERARAEKYARFVATNNKTADADRKEVTPIHDRVDRWKNWDAEADFWDDIEKEFEENKFLRDHGHGAARLERMRLSNLENKQYTIEQFSDGESENVAKMMKSPESGRVFSGRTMTNIKEANADREIISENAFAIEMMIEDGKALSEIVREFGIRSRAVLAREAKKRGWV